MPIAPPPEPNKRCRPYLKPSNKSYRIDETHTKVKATIDFLLTAKRDAAAAKRFLMKAIDASGNPMPRVMNVDKIPAYPAAVEALKADGSIPRRVTSDGKKARLVGQGVGIISECMADFAGIETVNMIRKGRVKWLAKRDGGGWPGNFHPLPFRTRCRLIQD